ncbi:transposase, IS982 family [Parageobacillus thermoglucosidasius TNO-09.020]|nr:transposase, IS982 family [Parageobacillus thermoglucosidasius TNO-09.020]
MRQSGFRKQGFPVFHAQLLQDLEVRYPQIVLIDSTLLGSSLYKAMGDGVRVRGYRV